MKRLPLLALAPLAVAAAGWLEAASVPRLELSEIVARSPRIVQGRVVRTWSGWDAGHRAIWTHAEVAVSRDLRGGAGSRVVISELGGVADGLEMHAPGAPRLRAGDEAVLFAYPTATGLWRLRGWSQGLRRIERDASGRALVRTAEPGVVGLEKVGPTAAASLPRTVASEPLEAFLTRVEALLAREAGR